MKNLVVLAVIAVLAFSTAVAGDLGLVKIKNDYQARVAQSILDRAYTRVEQGYLVLLSPQQTVKLNRAGIEYKTVMPDVDPSLAYLVYPHEKGGEAPASIAGAVEIGMGLRVVLADDAMSLSPEVHFGPRAVPLTGLEVKIQYIPKAVSNFFTTLEDYPTDTIADFVSQDSAYDYVTSLEDFETRYIWTESIDDARDWIAQKFLDFGYTDVSTPEFYYDGEGHYNVMAVKPGWAEPDKVIVVGAHYDSTCEIFFEPGPLIYAPGADDNASGTALVMELARIMSGLSFRKTVVFMAFSAEEFGLHGSYAAADSFIANGTDVEAMLNFDMIGYDPNDGRRVELRSAEITGYRDIMANAVVRVTSLSPVIAPMNAYSDHYAFYTRGFPIAKAEEYEIYPYYHSDEDTYDKLNFDYLTEIIKMAAASVGVIANAAHPTFITDIVDQGDGQSVEIFINNCDPDYTLTLHYGTVSGNYPYSLPIPSGQCSIVVDGLTEGQTYFFSVEGALAGVPPAAYVTEDSCVSYVVPRVPALLSAEPDIYVINLDWGDNLEADFSHYRVYRDEGSGLVLHKDNIEESQLADSNVTGLVDYVYRVSATDFDLNESGLSNADTARAFTFDRGILVVDETYDDFYLPSQAEQEAYFDSIFAEIAYGLDTVTGSSDTLSRYTAGSYSSMFWFDDDPGYKDIGYNESTIGWCLDNQVDALVAGWKTITSWDDSPIDTDHLLYKEFGIAEYVSNSNRDFAGAFGQNGWPSVTMDADNLWEGKFPHIAILTSRPGATVIYTYDSFTDDPAFEGQPCGILYETVNGRRIALAFPIYFLTAESSRNLIQFAVNALGEGGEYVYGDVDNSGSLDPLDGVYLVNYFWKGGPGPLNINAADVDGSCAADILDAVYLIDYLYRSGPAPLAGCVY